MWDTSESVEITLINWVFDLTPPMVDVYTPNGLASAALEGFLYHTWTGSDSNNWNTTGNWNTGMIPSGNTDVLIPADGIVDYPTLTASSTGACNNLLLESTATGNASILGNQYLAINGTATVQSYITEDQWHIVSQPVSGLQVGFYSLGGNPKVYLTEYDENSETYNYLTDPSTLLNNMQGYMLWVCDADNTYDYTGTLNSGSFGSTDNLTRNSSGSGDEGWNMVGNPYPSSIDWNSGSGWTKSANLGSAIYLYNNGIWEYYLDDSPSGHSTNGTRYIAPGQGFFVRVLSGTTGTLIMDDDVRVNHATEFFKTRELIPYVKLAASGNNCNDETIIRFKESATNEFDGEYDVFKKFTSNENYPQIYSNSGEKYYINTVSSIDLVPVSFFAGVDGDYTISIDEFDNIGNIWLEDLITGDYIDLTVKQHTFSYSIDDDPDRFILHFTPVSINEESPGSINIYSFNNKVFIRSSELLSGTVHVYNIAGQEIEAERLEGFDMNIPIDGEGYFLVSVITNNSTTTQKVFIQ